MISGLMMVRMIQLRLNFVTFCPRRHRLVRAAVGQPQRHFDQNLPCISVDVCIKFGLAIDQQSQLKQDTSGRPTGVEMRQVASIH